MATLEEIRALLPEMLACKTCKHSVLKVMNGHKTERQGQVVVVMENGGFQIGRELYRGLLNFSATEITDDISVPYPSQCESYKQIGSV